MSKSRYDRRSVSPSGYRTPSGAHDQILGTVRQLRVCECPAPLQTRGRVCHWWSRKSAVRLVLIDDDGDVMLIYPRGGATLGASGAKFYLIFEGKNERRVDFRKAVCIFHFSFT
jgi:hypothetical protein